MTDLVWKEEADIVTGELSILTGSPTEIREDSSEITVSIGGTAFDGNVYVMTSESDHIYTCDSYLATAFTFRLIDFEAVVEEEIEDTETE